MRGIYYPKYNLILIDGKYIFESAFICFLDQIYNLSLFITDKDNNICIQDTDDIREFLLKCLRDNINLNLNLCKNYIKDTKIYAKSVIYFSIQDLENNQEILSYLKKAAVFKCINKIIKEFNNKKTIFYTHTKSTNILFSDNITVISKPPGKIQEILNIINFNLH